MVNYRPHKKLIIVYFREVPIQNKSLETKFNILNIFRICKNNKVDEIFTGARMKHIIVV